MIVDKINNQIVFIQQEIYKIYDDYPYYYWGEFIITKFMI
jgi:hypothetical protein